MLPTAVFEVKPDDFIALIGKIITVFCANHIYTGILDGVNTTCIKLTHASIVYETGSFHEKFLEDAQKLPNDLYINIALIESYTILK